MNARITTDEVADQFAKAIKLYLEWSKQEIPTGNPIPAIIPPTSTKISDPNEWLTALAAAKILKVSKANVYSLMKRNEIPTVKIGERIVRVRREDLDEFIENGKVIY